MGAAVKGGRRDSSGCAVATTHPRISVVMIEHIPATDQASEPPRHAQTRDNQRMRKRRSRRREQTSTNYIREIPGTMIIFGQCPLWPLLLLFVQTITTRPLSFSGGFITSKLCPARSDGQRGGLSIGWHVTGAKTGDLGDIRSMQFDRPVLNIWMLARET
jgi:hypothetical protein